MEHDCKVPEKSESRNLSKSALHSRNHQGISQCLYKPSYSKVADPGPVSQVHLQNWDLLFSHMLLSPSLITVCVFWVTYMWLLYSVCLYSVWLCVYPDTGPLCSPAGWLIRSYSNNQLYFSSLSLSPYSFTLCYPPPHQQQHHHHLASEWMTRNNPPALLPLFFCFFFKLGPDWQIKQWVFESSPDTDIHSLICIRNKLLP